MFDDAWPRGTTRPSVEEWEWLMRARRRLLTCNTWKDLCVWEREGRFLAQQRQKVYPVSVRGTPVAEECWERVVTESQKSSNKERMNFLRITPLVVDPTNWWGRSRWKTQEGYLDTAKQGNGRPPDVEIKGGVVNLGGSNKEIEWTKDPGETRHIIQIRGTETVDSMARRLFDS